MQRVKLASVVGSESFRERQEIRTGGRDLDANIESSSGYHPAEKRAGRTFPKDYKYSDVKPGSPTRAVSGVRCRMTCKPRSTSAKR